MDNMLDTEIATTIKPDGTVEVKLVSPSDEETATETEMREANEALKNSETL